MRADENNERFFMLNDSCYNLKYIFIVSYNIFLKYLSSILAITFIEINNINIYM
jgi:hypothetical protein